MAGVGACRSDDDAARLNLLRLPRLAARDAVVADQRVGEGEDLPRIGGIGQRFDIAGHSRI